MGYARLQEAPFDAQEALAALRGPESGGVALYVGTVREQDEGRRVGALTYEAHPEMAQESLERLRRQAVERFGLLDALVIHRLGRFGPGEVVLLVAFSSVHRREAFEALGWFMDRLKAEVPIWKKEEGPQGPAWILGAENRRVVS